MCKQKVLTVKHPVCTVASVSWLDTWPKSKNEAMKYLIFICHKKLQRKMAVQQSLTIMLDHALIVIDN